MLRPILHTLIITGSLSLSAFSYADGPTLSLSVSQSGGSAQNDDGSPDATRPSESNPVFCLSGAMKPAPVVMIFPSRLVSVITI